MKCYFYLQVCAIIYVGLMSLSNIYYHLYFFCGLASLLHISISIILRVQPKFFEYGSVPWSNSIGNHCSRAPVSLQEEAK